METTCWKRRHCQFNINKVAEQPWDVSLPRDFRRHIKFFAQFNCNTHIASKPCCWDVFSHVPRIATHVRTSCNLRTCPIDESRPLAPVPRPSKGCNGPVPQGRGLITLQMIAIEDTREIALQRRKEANKQMPGAPAACRLL